MNEPSTFRTFIAKIQLYHDISLPFLRRNLTHIFDSHERLLRGHINAPETIAEDIRRRARWKPPTKAVMDEYCSQESARLTIDSFLLRAHSLFDEKSGNAAKVIKKGPRDDGPDWLPPPDDRAIRCQVAVNIHAKNSTRIVYSECKSGEMHRLEDTSNQIAFDLRLRAPFVIAADQLNTPTDESGHWERKMTDEYTLEIGISCLNSSDAAEFLAELDGRTSADYNLSKPTDGTIKAVWGKRDSNDPGLPALPPANTLLSLKRTSGHKSREMPYGLQPSISWNTLPGNSILTQHNKHMRRLKNTQQTPKPSPFQDAELPTKKRRSQCSVKYHFWTGGFNKRSVHMAELRCIFCDRDPEQPSIERLYDHYAAVHDHFIVLVEPDETDPDVKLFKMRLKEEEQELLNEPPRGDFDWEAPKEAFDATRHMDSHSRGERTRWETQQSEPIAYEGENRASGKTTIPKGRRGRPMAQPPSAIELTRTKTKYLPAKEVPDIPVLERRKHTVPHVPGIDFYRTTSKQVLNPGDLISDSDEDPDEFWLIERQRHDLRKIGMDHITREFHILISRAMDEERPMSDMLVRDSLVRLARENRVFLAQPTLTSLFRKKLMLLNRGGAISKKDMEYCLEVITNAALECDVEMGGTEPNELTQPSVNSKSKLSRTSFARSVPMTPRGTIEPSLQSSAQRTSLPFGRRKYICRRTNGSRQKPHHGDIDELVKDGETSVSIENITPRHLCWTKFKSILDEQLVWIRASDEIVCISDRTAALVTDERDWYMVLEQAADERHGDGTVIFELHTAHSYQKLLAGNSSSPQSSAAETKSAGKASAAQSMATKLADMRLGKRPCKCGEVVQGIRGVIACGNPMCSRNYHMACIGLQKRPMDWKCSSCTA